MKVKNKFLIIITFIVGFIFMSGAINIGINVNAQGVSNDAFLITAVGDDNGNGNTIYYYKIKTDDTVLSFDLLKGPDSGYFGIVDTLYTNYKNYLEKDNFVMFSPEGKQLKSKKLAEGSMVFEEGYNYKISIKKEGKKKMLEIGRKSLIASDGNYEILYQSEMNLPYTGVIGIALQSDGYKSASVVLDNVVLIDKGNELVNYNYDWEKNNDEKFAFYTDNKVSFAKIYNELHFNVSFYDLNGNLLKQETVCEYNYSYCTSAPLIDGKKFKKWSKSTVNINQDLVVYPVYENNIDDNTDNPVVPDNPDSSQNDEERKGGCGGRIDDVNGLLFILSSISIILIVRRKQNEKKY